MSRLILVADEPKELPFYEEAYRRLGYQVVPLQFRDEIEELVRHEKFVMALINIDLPDAVSGNSILARLRDASPEMILVAVRSSKTSTPIDGIHWVFNKPLKIHELQSATRALPLPH